MNASTQKPQTPLVPEICIDLPGEAVECWRSSNNIKVVLRKHRDIIFDINLGKGNSYTVESTESDFYNAIAKKLVFAARHGKVTFNDGERMHVWVSRGFRGALILKCNGHVLSRIEPNEWDKQRRGDDPKDKPAPIIITLGNPPVEAQLATGHPSTASHPSAPQQPQHEEQMLHIHEASTEGYFEILYGWRRIAPP